MSVAQQQFEKLRAIYPDATCTNLSDGSAWVVIPKLPLPAGWSQGETTVRFLLLPAYPSAKPDCFWTDENLRLATGSEPQASRVQPGHSYTGQLRWFSWHI